jgi:hypothetical protein
MSFSPKRAVQRSVIASGSEAILLSREAELNGVKNPLKRLALLSLHRAARQHPHIVSRLLRLDYRELDPMPIGSGSQSTVYRLGEQQVLKVVETSREYSLLEQQRKASEMIRDHSMLRLYLGKSVVPHQVFVAKHPMDYTQTAIQIQQPFVEAVDPELFIPGSGAVNKENIAGIRGQHEAANQLQELLFNSWQMHDSTFNRLLVDLRGTGNLGIDNSGQLLIIDGQPIGIDIDSGSHAQIARQHLNLAEQLQLSTEAEAA